MNIENIDLNVPPGLECLTSIDYLLLKRKSPLSKKFVIKNRSGQNVSDFKYIYIYKV